MKKWTVAVLMVIAMGLFWSCSDDNSTEPDKNYLEVSILSPINNSEFVIDDTVKIEIQASVNNIEFNDLSLYIDSAFISSSDSLFLSYEWDTSNGNTGTYIIKAVATDKDLNKFSDSISVVLKLPPFYVQITSPTNDSEFNDSEVLSIEVEAATDNGTINEVVLVIDRFTQCEKFIDSNNNGCFDREEFIDNNFNSNWDIGESYIDANYNNQYDGDFLYDSNANNKWDYWWVGQSFTGFNGDVYSNEWIHDYDGDNIIGNNEMFLHDATYPYAFDLQANFRFIDGDIFYDTGEPYVDQKRFYNIGNQIVELVNSIYDKDETICNLILKDNDFDYTESYPGGSNAFWERLDQIQNIDFYLATLLFDADSSNVTITYGKEVFADLRSSYGSQTQTTPRFNDIYDPVENGIQDEFEAYCSKRFYGSDVNDNMLGWTAGHSPNDNPYDYVEFIGSYTIFRCPNEIYNNMPNISNLTFDSYSTWIDTNNNGYFETPNSTYDLGERYITGSIIEAFAIDNNDNSVEDKIFIKIKP